MIYAVSIYPGVPLSEGHAFVSSDRSIWQVYPEFLVAMSKIPKTLQIKSNNSVSRRTHKSYGLMLTLGFQT